MPALDPNTIPISGGTPPLYGMQNVNLQYGQQAGEGASANQQSALSTFSPQQQALQNQLLGNMTGMLSGSSQVPAYMTAPPEVFAAYNEAFNKYVKPGIAAQYGAGSPQIGGQQSYGNRQLAAQLYQSGLSNWQGLMNQAGSLAFNPIGQTAANQGQNNWNQNSMNMGISDTTYGTSLLSMLMGLIPQYQQTGGTGGI